MWNENDENDMMININDNINNEMIIMNNNINGNNIND